MLAAVVVGHSNKQAEQQAQVAVVLADNSLLEQVRQELLIQAEVAVVAAQLRLLAAQVAQQVAQVLS
jgi:hypothetical protein